MATATAPAVAPTPIMTLSQRSEGGDPLGWVAQRPSPAKTRPNAKTDPATTHGTQVGNLRFGLGDVRGLGSGGGYLHRRNAATIASAEKAQYQGWSWTVTRAGLHMNRHGTPPRAMWCRNAACAKSLWMTGFRCKSRCQRSDDALLLLSQLWDAHDRLRRLFAAGATDGLSKLACSVTVLAWRTQRLLR